MSRRILITGAGSYIGTSFERYLTEHPDENTDAHTGYTVDTLDMQDPAWREYSFKGYDTVFHVAGIAHADTGKASQETKDLYYKINCGLTVETAEKAKLDGVRQFIFMSSIIVYGNRNTVITKDTIPNPDSFYGDSKLQADLKLKKLSDDTFKVVILRPPMVYGKGSKGNFPRLAALAKKTPIFPDYPNRRSMIYIENLCAFIKQVIDSGSKSSGTDVSENSDTNDSESSGTDSSENSDTNDSESSGTNVSENSGTNSTKSSGTNSSSTGTQIYFPQNKDYVNTTELVKTIAAAHGKRVRTTKLFNPIITLAKHRIGSINKLFGDLAYEMPEQTDIESTYNVVDFEESINRSVGQDEDSY